MPEGDTIAIDAKDRALHDTAREAVHSSPVAAIVALAEERGISLSAIQALTRLPLTRLLDPDRRLDDQVALEALLRDLAGDRRVLEQDALHHAAAAQLDSEVAVLALHLLEASAQDAGLAIMEERS